MGHVVVNMWVFACQILYLNSILLSLLAHISCALRCHVLLIHDTLIAQTCIPIDSSIRRNFSNMHSALVQTSCNSSLTLLEAAGAWCAPNSSITVLLILGWAQWSSIYAIREHLICCNLFTVYVNVANGRHSIITRLKHLVPVRRENKVVLLEHGICILQRVLWELVWRPLDQLIASGVFRTAHTHLAGGSYNATVIALHSPVCHYFCLCTECLLTRLAGGEPVV